MKKCLRKMIGALCRAAMLDMKDLRGREIGSLDLAAKLQRRNLLILESRSEPEVLAKFAEDGAVAQPQYESVRAGASDVRRLETLARASGATTNAGAANHTAEHQDGYQFWREYMNLLIAGIGHMPDIEILGYPRVVEERWLEFFDLPSAALGVLAQHGTRFLSLLTKPLFTIDPKYRAEDSALGDPGFFPIVFRDRLGVRFHIGGSVIAPDPEANVALTLFRDEMRKTAITLKVESDSLFVVNQRVIAHRGIRWCGRDGLTLLTRVLLRYEATITDTVRTS